MVTQQFEDRTTPIRFLSFTCNCCEQIQVRVDSVLVQAITENSVIQDENYLFWGILNSCNSLNANQLEVRDVNFDGSEAFGIYRGTTCNGPMYWFLRDEAAWKSQSGFFSSVDLTVDAEKEQLADA